jgi:ribosome-associated protein YbcJ (S4-like RNA binding protein)
VQITIWCGKGEKPQQRGLKKEAIIRVLLNHKEEEITKYRVAKLANVSDWCREYTKKLENKGLLNDTEVLKPHTLYQEWQEIRVKPSQLELSLQQPMQLLQETDLKYALTTYQTENMHQGLLFASKTDFYIDPEEINEWHQLLKEKGLVGGGNTRIRVLDRYVFYNGQKIKKHFTVSIPQLILDLLDEAGPCKEAGEKLIEEFHGENQNG